MKNLLLIMFVSSILCSCYEYKKFTVYKQAPFDNTSDSIYLDKVFTVKYFKESYPEYIQYNQFIFHSNGTYGCCYIDKNIEHVVGHYIIRHDTIFMQRFGQDPEIIKRYLKEYFAKIINDSTIIFYFHRCNFCHGQFSGYGESADIYFKPPLEYTVSSKDNKSEIYEDRIFKKKWYIKNVWYNKK